MHPCSRRRRIIDTNIIDQFDAGAPNVHAGSRLDSGSEEEEMAKNNEHIRAARCLSVESHAAWNRAF